MKVIRPIDDDGNEIPAPDPSSDVGQLIYLLEYARDRGFRLGPTIQVGETIVQVKDLRQFEATTKKDKDDVEPDIWAANGHDE